MSWTTTARGAAPEPPAVAVLPGAVGGARRFCGPLWSLSAMGGAIVGGAIVGGAIEA